MKDKFDLVKEFVKNKLINEKNDLKKSSYLEVYNYIELLEKKEKEIFLKIKEKLEGV